MWDYSSPLIAPEARINSPSHAQKDPSVVFYDGKWHVFMTVKLPGKSAIEYCAFEKWEAANASPRKILQVSESNYYCAPQVFFFRPHKKWYLIYQVGMPGMDKMWVAFSTTTNVAAPATWTRAAPILDGGKDDPRKVGGLDYWIICDDQRAYLFLTSLDGRMWRLWTRLEDFPREFAHCELALEAKIFEASHTYKLKGRNQYLTLIEENGRRFYKAYLADRLDGEWDGTTSARRLELSCGLTTSAMANSSAKAAMKHSQSIRPTVDSFFRGCWINTSPVSSTVNSNGALEC
jgi:hypothetical protein